MILKILKPFRLQPFYNFGSFTENMEKKQFEKQQQEFIKEIEFLSSKPTFTLADFRIRVIDGLFKLQKGLKYKFMGGNELTQQQMEIQKKILNSFYTHELQDFKLLKGDEKQEISIVSQQPIQEINKLLRNYEQQLKIHQFLRLIKEKGETLPQTQDELYFRYRRDSKNQKKLLKFRFKKYTMSKLQMRRRIKWGVKKAM